MKNIVLCAVYAARSAALSVAAAAVLVNAGCAKETDAINLISREEGSGTRSAFVELFGIVDADKRDAISPGAETTNNTAVMMTTVAGDKNAIGYISLGSLNDTVKALNIDGAVPSAENVRAGTYGVARPFLIAVKGEAGPEAADFISFILSASGQDTVRRGGYVPLDTAPPFKGGAAAGKVIVAGSSSVTPVMEKLREAYLNINPALDIEIQQSDSSTGMNAAIEGICDIGMASRELKQSERDKGLRATVIAIDGLVVIVNKNNPVDTLSQEQVRAVFSGDTRKWPELREHLRGNNDENE